MPLVDGLLFFFFSPPADVRNVKRIPVVLYARVDRDIGFSNGKVRHTDPKHTKKRLNNNDIHNFMYEFSYCLRMSLRYASCSS